MSLAKCSYLQVIARYGYYSLRLVVHWGTFEELIGGRYEGPGIINPLSPRLYIAVAIVIILYKTGYIFQPGCGSSWSD